MYYVYTAALVLHGCSMYILKFDTCSPTRCDECLRRLSCMWFVGGPLACRIPLHP